MSKHILIVDDETDVVEVIKKRLEFCGYSVGSAENGVAGLSYLRTHKVDLAILDIMMPVMDGSELADILKNDPKMSKVPVIFLSAILEKKEPLGGNIGPNVVLAKPFDAEELLENVKLLLHEA